LAGTPVVSRCRPTIGSGVRLSRTLLSLVRDFVPGESTTPLDNLDPYRRIELGHPAISTDVLAAVRAVAARL
jgi:hypothetical protein